MRYYFTFGAGQVNAGRCQVVEAESMDMAREKMFEVYGDKWCFGYTEEQWLGMKNNPNRPYRMELELPVVLYCK